MKVKSVFGAAVDVGGREQRVPDEIARRTIGTRVSETARREYDS